MYRSFFKPKLEFLVKPWSQQMGMDKNKAGYTATEVACGWAGAIFEVTRPFGQE